MAAVDDKIQDQPIAQHVNNSNDISDNEKSSAAFEGDPAAAEHAQQLTPDELEAEKKLRKKIDLRIMPIVVLIYLMNYIDRYVLECMRIYLPAPCCAWASFVLTVHAPLWWGLYRNNYAAARLQGLEEDLNMTDKEYQIGLSTLFVGYVLMQVPSNALLNYAGRPSLYIGFFVRAVPVLFCCCLSSLISVTNRPASGASSPPLPRK